MIHRSEVVLTQRVARVEAGRVSREGNALNVGSFDRRGYGEVLAHVVEEELPAARAAHGLDERIDIGGAPGRS